MNLGTYGLNNTPAAAEGGCNIYYLQYALLCGACLVMFVLLVYLAASRWVSDNNKSRNGNSNNSKLSKGIPRE